MPDLPAKSDFTDNLTTEGDFRTSFDDMIDFLTNVIGSKDGRVEVFSGTDGTRPSTTESGWIRYNTTNHVMDISIGASPTWSKLVHSTIDATWKWFLEVGQASGLMISNASGTDCTMRIDSTGGYVEVGVDSDEAFIKSESTRPIRQWINGVAVSKMDSTGEFTVTGDLTASGVVTVSDRRFKKNINPIDNAMTIINRMNGYTFTKTRNNQESAGVIAQEIQKAFPQAVRTYKENDTEYLAVDYTTIIGPLINAVKELDARVKDLERVNGDSK